MPTPAFDLIDIAQALHRRRILIWIVTALSALTAGIAYLVSKKDYKAKSEFFVSNPLYSDRNNFFRTDESRFVDYFTNEDDMDKVIAIANSELVRVKVIERQGLFNVYDLDSSEKNDKALMALKFRNRYDVKRTENQNMEITYTDSNPNVAANVANEAVSVVEEVYRGYFNDLRSNICKAIADKSREADSSIEKLTDTLARLRDRYGIYDIVNPARAGIGITTPKGNGSQGFARGMEELQNLEAIKDQMVKDRAGYTSLIAEFSTGTKAGQLPLVHVITAASPPIEHTGLTLLPTILGGMFLGLFFSTVIVLISTYYQKLLAVQRDPAHAS